MIKQKSHNIIYTKKHFKMRQKIFIPAITVLLTLFLLACSNKSDDRITSFLETQYPKDGLGAVVEVTKDEKIIAVSAFGLADKKDKTDLNDKMVFPIASMTKAYTAVAIMQLQEKQLLNLEDNITKYLTDFPTEYEQVKIKHLLSNTSGVLSYNRMPEYQQINNKKELSLNSMIELIRNKPLSYQPGTKFRYSNSNYILLTKIIEVISKSTYQEFLKANIFNIANLKETFFKHQQTTPTGYEYRKDTIIENSEDTHHTYGAGMLYATSNDVITFLNALNNEKLISQKSVDYIYSIPLKHNDGRPDEYANGVWVTNFKGERAIKLEGYCNGFYTMAFYIPNHNIAITIFSNSSGYPLPVNQTFIAEWIYRHLTNKKSEIYKEVDLSETDLKKYEGVYQIDSANFIQVFVEDNTLFTLRSGGQTMEAKAYGKNKFYYPNSFTSFEFSGDKNNLKMLMYDDENKKSSAIITDKEIRKAVTIDASILEKYVGKYEKRFQIFIKNNELMFTNGFYTYKLLPLSETKFYPHHEDAVFTFEDKAGLMNLTYSIGNFSMTVKKIEE